MKNTCITNAAAMEGDTRPFNTVREVTKAGPEENPLAGGQPSLRVQPFYLLLLCMLLPRRFCILPPLPRHAYYAAAAAILQITAAAAARLLRRYRGNSYCAAAAAQGLLVPRARKPLPPEKTDGVSPKRRRRHCFSGS